jgi:hypothetical protein
VAAGAAAEWCAARYWEPQSAALAAKRGATAAALRELAAAHVPAAPGPRRSSAAHAPRDSDDDGEDEEAEEDAALQVDAPRAGPSASALRRRRGAALRVLADLVPPAGAPLLVAPLLDDGLLAPPAQAEPPPPLPPQPQLPQPPSVDDAVWDATLRTLEGLADDLDGVRVRAQDEGAGLELVEGVRVHRFGAELQPMEASWVADEVNAFLRVAAGLLAAPGE